MQKDDWKNILMIIATLVVSIISWGFFNLFVQLIFIFIFILICCQSFSYLNNKTQFKKYLLIVTCIAELALLGVSMFGTNGSFANFWNRIRELFVPSQNVTSEGFIVSEEELESYFDEFNEQIDEFNQKIEKTNSNMESLSNDLTLITDNMENIRFNDHIDEVEINAVLKIMDDYCEKYSSDFSDVKADIYQLELLYKLFISREPYYYCNILEAFEKYGINNDKLGITENILFVWDTEILFARYNIDLKVVRASCQDENANAGTYTYNDNRVTKQKYSDTFDYGNWQVDYSEKTLKDAASSSYNRIMDYYKKFIINFSE